jgi:hypothetical protein
VLDLSPGSAVILDGRQWTVQRREPHLGQVLLADPDGKRRNVTFQFLLNHPKCFTSSRTAAMGANRGRQEAIPSDLERGRRDIARLRMAHVLEMRTGFRSGSHLRPGPGEPRPEYDPAVTTLTQRRLAKATELAALDPAHARDLGLQQVSYRTLLRWDLGERDAGLMGCADHRWLRESGGHPSITERVRSAILAVREDTRLRARNSLKDKYLLVCQEVRDSGGSEEEVPSYRTFARVWKEWFGPGGTRPRNAGTGDLPASFGHVTISRPGQVVALDTTVLPVKVRDNVFGDPVSVHLTLGLDVYTHSLVAFRLTLVSDKSVDVAMLLRDVMMPLPMRPGWGPEMAWPYPGMPAAVVAEFAGYEPAGLPFFTPEIVTTDHGSVYKNHALREAERVLGCAILPARVLRPQDKAACERAFNTIRQLLLAKLPGYTGVDVADRGRDPEGDACLTVAEMEHLIASWIVGVWQVRVLEHSPPYWDPDGVCSPNALVAIAFGQAGLALEVPRPELFYELLPVHSVATIDSRRGIKARGLWYDDPDVLVDDYRSQPSTRGGKDKKRWTVRIDPRDRRYVYFQDPFTHAWHPLPWTGLPEDGNVPAFADARVAELLKTVRDLGMKPRTDAELLPVLLDLIDAAVPVSQWPSKVTKARRTARAREIAQAAAAAADRPQGEKTGRGGPEGTTGHAATARRRLERPRTPREAVVAERLRRSEGTPQGPARIPRQLGASSRDNNPFAPPKGDEEDPRS